MNTPVEVLLRAIDTPYATYIYWRWLDDPDALMTRGIPRETLVPLLDELATAMMTPLDGEDPEFAARRALTSGPFTNPSREQDLSTRLAAAILPDGFWDTLIAHQGSPVRVRITPSSVLARVPWELLPLPDGTRLIQVATLVYEVPSTIHWNRDPLPTPWENVRGQPTLATIDPAVPVLGAVLADTLTAGERSRLLDAIGAVDHGRYITREDLSALLHQHPSTWIYFGHVSLNYAEPGSASLHLYDGTSYRDGRALPYAGTAELIEDTHRPLSALDLLLGTSQDAHRDPGLRYAHPGTVLGHEIWPMPPRVALIACESGGDYAASETFGLVVAAHSNGAEYVTATRWTLPTDHAFALHHPGLVSTYPTSDLAVNVHRALQTTHPIDVTRTWQLKQLHQWAVTGHITHTPLIFASIAVHHAPRRNPDGSPAQHGDSVREGSRG